MMSDIIPPKVENIAIAVIPKENELGETEWNCYLINMKPETITNVLVRSRGYGKKNNEEVKTSELRHFLGDMPENSHQQIELIPEELHGLNNQYWVSFYLGGKLYDKKYVFVPESIQEANLTRVPVVEEKGVLII